jgi:hypothetical protein
VHKKTTDFGSEIYRRGARDEKRFAALYRELSTAKFGKPGRKDERWQEAHNVWTMLCPTQPGRLICRSQPRRSPAARAWP